jgi:hypothetical protein
MTKKRGGSFLLNPAPGFEAVRAHMLANPLPVPPTARECIAQGLLPYGLRPERRSMTPLHMRTLIERHPGLYRHADDKPVPTSEPFAREGFACGDGWFSIIERLSLKLAEDSNLVVSQLKEKMGRLVVYFDDSTPASPELEAATDAVLDAVTEESKRTCEVCGQPGTFLERNKWYSVRCGPCSWLDAMLESCRLLAGKRLATDQAKDAAQVRIMRLGEAARHQTPERRARLPGIDWKRLDGLRRFEALHSRRGSGPGGGASMTLHPTEDERLLSPDEIREGMRLAMVKAGRKGRVILFGGYSRGDYLTDIGILVVVDAYQRNQIQDIYDLRRCIELDRGIALLVVTAEKYEIQKEWCATACYDAEEYGVFLFDNREEP